ncbi:glycosyltransferase family 4 protein [Chloroflexota bacterium]
MLKIVRVPNYYLPSQKIVDNEIVLKPILRIVDILLAALLLLRFTIWAALTYIDTNYLRRRQKTEKINMLDITMSSSYSSYKERGLLSNLMQQEEDGYIEKYFTIYPFTETTRTIELSDRTTLIEWSSEKFSRWQDLGFKYSRYVLIMWHFFHYCVNLIQDEEINIIRSNNPFTSAAIAFMCSKLTRTPFCVAVRHEFDVTARYTNAKKFPTVIGSQKLAMIIQRLVLSRANRIIPTNESRAKYAIRHGARRERIRMDPFRINISKFPKPSSTLKKELGIEDKKAISFIGRLVSYNYVTDIIHIAAKVYPHRNDAIFLMVGDGDERKVLEELSHSLRLDDIVKFLGMQQWQKSMQIRVISDVSLCLMAGNSLVEAAVAATPLIAYDVDWHYELVRNNETGFLLPEGDINGVAEAIIKLLDDHELAQRLGQNARKLAIERHSTERVRRIRIQLYEELLRSAK